MRLFHLGIGAVLLGLVMLALAFLEALEIAWMIGAYLLLCGCIVLFVSAILRLLGRREKP